MTSWEFGAASSYEEAFEKYREILENKEEEKSGSVARNIIDPQDKKRKTDDPLLIKQTVLHPADQYFIDLYKKAKKKRGLTKSMRRSLKRKYGNLSDLALLFQFSRDRYKIQRFQAEIDYYLYRRDDINVLS